MTTKELIPAYSFEYAPVEPHVAHAGGGFQDGQLHQMYLDGTSPDELDIYQVLDNLTLACEEGLLNKVDWYLQLFANDASVHSFIEQLRFLDERCLMRERWWQALAMLAGADDATCFARSAHIAEKLETVIRRDRLRHGTELPDADSRRPRSPRLI